ncbi:zinc metalloprotease [Kordia sp. YSTF-M3]|uniref:Zinc metalloprotease n=1 Tax=Kordia aestuariivivens TaxID=2759037 RepID=A0ABR7Q735_9FLAO|nr:zinc metalloprotease [Kordia aestuariivivens]MBC8754381.1 zinc metalloprotease [Kordia aestuariivivens]
MKKVFLSMIAVATIMVSCSDDQTANTTDDAQVAVDMSDFYLHTDNSEKAAGGCFTMQKLNDQLDKDPQLAEKMYNIEKRFRQDVLSKAKPANPGGGNGGGGGDPEPPTDNLGVVTIPVYIHVVYSNSNENISDAQINSQMAVLNDDFRKTNNDANQVPSLFSGVAADTEIQFSLAQTFRYSNSRTSWGTNNLVKSTYPPVTPSTHMNIWVCNIGGGILGYAQFPGGSPSTDGIVVGPQFFGTTGYVASPFDEGRTTTHEVGHYLNLRHIWGDGRCNRDDFVSDTPTSDAPNYGCPSFPTTNCRSTDMTMNYMDYTNDACMYMFSTGQKTRMRGVLVAGGARETLVN